MWGDGTWLWWPRSWSANLQVWQDLRERNARSLAESLLDCTVRAERQRMLRIVVGLSSDIVCILAICSRSYLCIWIDSCSEGYFVLIQHEIPDSQKFNSSVTDGRTYPRFARARLKIVGLIEHTNYDSLCLFRITTHLSEVPYDRVSVSDWSGTRDAWTP